MESITVSVHHGILFILDPANAGVLIPEYVDDQPVASTASCLSVVVQPSVDGDVEVSLGFREAAPTGLFRIALGHIAVPHGTVAVDTADEGVLLERTVPAGRATVSIWVDELRGPTRMFVNIEGALGSV
jgi:hypothetical protein